MFLMGVRSFAPRFYHKNLQLAADRVAGYQVPSLRDLLAHELPHWCLRTHVEIKALGYH